MEKNTNIDLNPLDDKIDDKDSAEENNQIGTVSSSPAAKPLEDKKGEYKRQNCKKSKENFDEKKRKRIDRTPPPSKGSPKKSRNYLENWSISSSPLEFKEDNWKECKKSNGCTPSPSKVSPKTPPPLKVGPKTPPEKSTRYTEDWSLSSLPSSSIGPTNPLWTPPKNNWKECKNRDDCTTSPSKFSPNTPPPLKVGPKTPPEESRRYTEDWSFSSLPSNCIGPTNPLWTPPKNNWKEFEERNDCTSSSSKVSPKTPPTLKVGPKTPPEESGRYTEDWSFPSSPSSGIGPTNPLWTPLKIRDHAADLYYLTKTLTSIANEKKKGKMKKNDKKFRDNNWKETKKRNDQTPSSSKVGPKTSPLLKVGPKTPPKESRRYTGDWSLFSSPSSSVGPINRLWTPPKIKDNAANFYYLTTLTSIADEGKKDKMKKNDKKFKDNNWEESEKRNDQTPSPSKVGPKTPPE